jgi:hypothetical protein
MMMTIKATYLVTDMGYVPSWDEDGDPVDHKTEKEALRVAADRLANEQGQDAEVWVWKLSHVLSKPEVDPVIDRVK